MVVMCTCGVLKVVMCTCGGVDGGHVYLWGVDGGHVYLWGVDGGDLYYTWCGFPPPQRGHTRVRVTHSYVEVPDHSDA